MNEKRKAKAIEMDQSASAAHDIGSTNYVVSSLNDEDRYRISD